MRSLKFLYLFKFKTGNFLHKKLNKIIPADQMSTAVPCLLKLKIASGAKNPLVPILFFNLKLF